MVEFSASRTTVAGPVGKGNFTLSLSQLVSHPERENRA